MFGFKPHHSHAAHDEGGRRHARGDFWPHGGHGPQHGRGGRLGRLFAHGDLHLLFLHLIAEKPRHGYETIKAVEEMVGGAYSPSPGTVYPTLTMLEEQGYATVSTEEGGKKLYTATAEGRAYLDLNQGAVSALLERVGQIGRERSGARPPQLVRAVEGLRMALALKSGSAPLSLPQIEAIVEALDEATRKIERA